MVEKGRCWGGNMLGLRPPPKPASSQSLQAHGFLPQIKSGLRISPAWVKPAWALSAHAGRILHCALLQQEAMGKGVPSWFLGLFNGCRLKDHPSDPPRRQDPARGRGSGLLAGGCCCSPHVQVEAGHLDVFKLPERHQQDAVTRAASAGLAASRQDSRGIQAGGSSLGETPNHPGQPGKVVGEPQGRDFCPSFVFHLPGPAARVRPDAWQAPVGSTLAEPQLLVGVSGDTPPQSTPKSPGHPLQPPMSKAKGWQITG